MRLKGVDKIPELIEALSDKASETTMKVQQKTQEVRKIAGVIEQIASATPSSPLKPAPDTIPLCKNLGGIEQAGELGGYEQAREKVTCWIPRLLS